MRPMLSEHDEFGNDTMPRQNGGIDQTQLLKLLEGIEKKCQEIRAKYLDEGSRAIEAFTETYVLKEKLRAAAMQARDLDPGEIRPYRNLALREFERNYPAAQQRAREATSASEIIADFRKNYRR
jgi:hypothetical protein